MDAQKILEAMLNASHSLGVMELASRIFDIATNSEHIHHESVRNIIPDDQSKSYWKSVLRMAALCHDLGHLPFSHAAEKELLPNDYNHERLTRDIIYSAEMEEIWAAMTPPLRADDIVKLAIGPKHAEPLELNKGSNTGRNYRGRCIWRRHRYFYTPRELDELLKGIGFVGIESRSFITGIMCYHISRKPPS